MPRPFASPRLIHPAGTDTPPVYFWPAPYANGAAALARTLGRVRTATAVRKIWRERHSVSVPPYRASAARAGRCSGVPCAAVYTIASASTNITARHRRRFPLAAGSSPPAKVSDPHRQRRHVERPPRRLPGHRGRRRHGYLMLTGRHRLRYYAGDPGRSAPGSSASSRSYSAPCPSDRNRDRPAAAAFMQSAFGGPPRIRAITFHFSLIRRKTRGPR